MTLVNAGLNNNLMVLLGSLFLGITCSIGSTFDLLFYFFCRFVYGTERKHMPYAQHLFVGQPESQTSERNEYGV